MADIEGIARKLYNIIISPDTVTGLINGGLSVPLDYGYLIYGIFDTDTRYERETERIRMMTAIRHDILNYENIVNAVKLIFQLFNKYLSESEQDRIYRSVVTSIVGRISTNIIASNIAKAVIEKDKVRLTSSRVKNPKYVRYAWQPFTRANLINKEALPASTFKAKCE